MHPGSLVRWEHIASGEAELHPHLYFELSALFRYEEKQQQTEVCFPSFQRTTVRKGEPRCQVGGETWQGEMWQNQEKRCSRLCSSLVCHDPGNEKKFDPGLVPLLELKNIAFPQSPPGIGWLSILSSRQSLQPLLAQPGLLGNQPHCSVLSLAALCETASIGEKTSNP